ncbi:MAG: tetraether lipid synthase Tes [Desulfohalobiaceae bacterium]
MFNRKNSQPQGVKPKEPSLPEKTTSICPECQNLLQAELYSWQGQVWMSKTCNEHGTYQELICSDLDFFLHRKRRHYNYAHQVQNPGLQSSGDCPHDCGICSNHKTSPCMVNIDLTNRCNLNCPICFANAQVTGQVCELTLDQLEQIIDNAMAIRPTPPLSIQFAGGEPTVHPNFIDAVQMARDKGVMDIQVASNGIKFARDLEFTKAAKRAGLDVVYLQFDGLSDDIYQESRGRPMWETKQKALQNMKAAGLMATLVPTLVRGLNDHQVGQILDFALQNTDVVTAISFQPVSITGRIQQEKRKEMRYTMADMARDLQDQSGIMDMYRDWYPFSIVNPVSRLLQAIDGRAKTHFTCHPHCGVASYLLVDTVTQQAVPFTKFLDIEAAMQDLDQEAAKIENSSWRAKLSKINVMWTMKKHYYPDQAPEGLDFDQLLEFVNGFSQAGNEHRDARGHYYHKVGDRYHVLLLAAMHFQDNYNFELQRVQNCIIHYGAPDGRLYPFCTWNSGPCHRYRVQDAYSNRNFQKEEQRN